MDLIANEGPDQLKIHEVHQKMQEWAKELPMPIQLRMSCELLANLAACIVSDTTVFEIINSLIDIQHMTEDELFYSRNQLLKVHKEKEIMLAENSNEKFLELQISEMRKIHRNELISFDMRVIRMLDDKMEEQQQVLESAGVPGFFQTIDPFETQVQICLLDFIIRSSKLCHPSDVT